MIYTVKGFGINNKAVDVFLELCRFFSDPTDVGNLTSGSSAFSKTILNIWKLMFHVLLKPGLENFEHYFGRVWDECSYAVVWATIPKLTFNYSSKVLLPEKDSEVMDPNSALNTVIS